MEWEQREILFRGQDLHTKKWKYGYFQQTEHGAAYINSQDKGCGFEHFQVIPETVTQYTGLKDSKGKKIFEGDILKTDIGDLTVSWNNEYSSFCLNRTGWLFNYWSHEACEPKDCTIIGNVFENPELLRGNG